MNRRRTLAALLACGVFPLKAWAQAPLRRIGVLAFRARPASLETDQSYGVFVHSMRDLGHVEGRNLAIEWRFADSKYERMPELAAELAKLPIDVLVTHTTPGVRAALAATRTIPIVSASMTDPVASGITSSLARPDRNVTGLVNLNADVAPKQFELIKSTLPRVTRVGYLYNSRNATIANGLKDARAAVSSSLRITIVPVDVASADDIERAFAGLGRQGIGAVVVSNESLFLERASQLVTLSQRYRVPAVFFYSEFVRGGGMMSYGESIYAVWHRTAFYVDRILKGARPADLPMEQTSKLYLAVNRSTAAALGVVIPDEVLLRADEVIQ
jgi:putative ABC transport system substrate-binding protein